MKRRDILIALSVMCLFLSFSLVMFARDKNTTTYYVHASVEHRDPNYPTLRGVGANGAEVLCITPTDTIKRVFRNGLLEFDIPKGTEVVFRATYDGYEPVEEKWVTNEPRMNVALFLKKKK